MAEYCSAVLNCFVLFDKLHKKHFQIGYLVSFSYITEAYVEWFKQFSADLKCTNLSAPLIEFKSYKLLTVVRGPWCLHRV